LLGQKDDGAEIQGIVVGGPADKQGELKLNDRIIAVAQGDEEFVDVKYLKLQKIVDHDPRRKGHHRAPQDRSGGRSLRQRDHRHHPRRGAAEREARQCRTACHPADLGKTLKVGWINLSNFYADMENGTVSTSADVERLLRRLMKEKDRRPCARPS
jgi:carboxyl-terminal processing protease